jgi:SHS2 domain-containing protein
MNGYAEISHDPRVLRVFGTTRRDLFEQAAYAVFDQGYVLEQITATYSRPVMAAGDDSGELLGNWLAELLEMSRATQIAPSFFVVDRLEDGGVQGSAAGLPMTEAVHRSVVVMGLAAPPADPVPVPEGWWVDVTVLLEPRLRSI